MEPSFVLAMRCWRRPRRRHHVSLYRRRRSSGQKCLLCTELSRASLGARAARRQDARVGGAACRAHTRSASEARAPPGELVRSRAFGGVRCDGGA